LHVGYFNTTEKWWEWYGFWDRVTGVKVETNKISINSSARAAMFGEWDTDTLAGIVARWTFFSDCGVKADHVYYTNPDFAEPDSFNSQLAAVGMEYHGYDFVCAKIDILYRGLPGV